MIVARRDKIRRRRRAFSEESRSYSWDEVGV